MNLIFPSDEWIKELSRQLNASETYAKSAESWEGDFIFIVEPDETFPQKVYLYLDLFHGKSPSAAQINNPDEKRAGYTISAPYKTWLKVIKGKLDPIQGMMTRQLKLQGNMMQIMRYPRAAKEIVSCCTLVPTVFDES